MHEKQMSTTEDTSLRVGSQEATAPSQGDLGKWDQRQINQELICYLVLHLLRIKLILDQLWRWPGSDSGQSQVRFRPEPGQIQARAGSDLVQSLGLSG